MPNRAARISRRVDIIGLKSFYARPSDPTAAGFSLSDDGRVKMLRDRHLRDTRGELFAERRAAFQCADVGLERRPCKGHGACIESSLKLRQDDKRCLFSATAQAKRLRPFAQF
jgi:antirestriction protein ArdC